MPSGRTPFPCAISLDVPRQGNQIKTEAAAEALLGSLLKTNLSQLKDLLFKKNNNAKEPPGVQNALGTVGQTICQQLLFSILS